MGPKRTRKWGVGASIRKRMLGGRGTASAFHPRTAAPREVLRSGALGWDYGGGSLRMDQWGLGQSEGTQMAGTRMAGK